TLERKLKEIIQSIRLTEAYPGVEGKQQIIAAYLNQNYYGNQAYGIKAAAKSYFGVDDLFKLTPAQAAILAGLPKSPSNYDLVKNSEEQCVEPSPADTEETCASSKGTELVVPQTTAIVEKWVQAAAIVPHAKDPAALAKTLKIPGGYAQWMKNLRTKDVHNGAMVALDYQTGELIAYVGSANYYAPKSTPQFQAKFDV